MLHFAGRAYKTAVVLLLILPAIVLSSSAYAADAVSLAHRAIRNKILKEAGDRYDVTFATTHVERLEGGLREVTGRGRFKRFKKPSQIFTYHTTVNIYDRSDKHTGYDIR